MGFFDGMRINKMGQQAYNVHAQANDLQKRGRVVEANAKYEEAMRLYQQAYDAGCKRTGILMSYSILMMRRGMFAEARQLMLEISKDKTMSEETHFDLRVNYSICLWRLGILDKAIETIRYAGKHAKNSAYYSALGNFLVDQAAQNGDFTEAEALLAEAMEYDDEDAATLDNLGAMSRAKSEIALREGDAEEAAKQRKAAIDYYERARKAKPSQVTTLYALAQFYAEDGRTDEARELIDRAMIHLNSRVCPVSTEMLMDLKAGLA